jgi:hypothetical protein
MVNKDTELTALQPFDELVSCFSSVMSVDSEMITLREWLAMCKDPSGAKAERLRNVVENIRNCSDSDMRIELKKTLPAISPGALMTTRLRGVPNEDKIINITGWMQFDIDLKDNSHIKDARFLRNEVRKIVYVAFCSLSVSGKGVWGLVKVKYIKKYREHFEQLKRDFASRKIFLDPSKGGNPTDLRIYSYDFPP